MVMGFSEIMQYGRKKVDVSGSQYKSNYWGESVDLNPDNDVLAIYQMSSLVIPFERINQLRKSAQGVWD